MVSILEAFNKNLKDVSQACDKRLAVTTDEKSALSDFLFFIKGYLGSQRGIDQISVKPANLGLGTDMFTLDLHITASGKKTSFRVSAPEKGGLNTPRHLLVTYPCGAINSVGATSFLSLCDKISEKVLASLEEDLNCHSTHKTVGQKKQAPNI